jgi:hypothetical protein
MPRPRAKVDPSQVEDLAKLGCTNEEVAAALGVSADTIERRFAGAIQNGRLQFRVSVRRIQYHLAEQGNAAMAIWLGKQYLGQTEKRVAEPNDACKLTDAELVELAKAALGGATPKGNAGGG